MSTRDTSQELSKKLTSHIEELAQTTDAARMSEAISAYLERIRQTATEIINVIEKEDDIPEVW